MPQVSRRRSSSHVGEGLLSHDWVDGTMNASSQPTYSAPAISPLQFGPLTAQDEYVATMDWPQSTTTTVSGQFNPSGQHEHQLVLDNNDVHRHGLDPWIHSGDQSRLESTGVYDIYGPMLGAQYPNPLVVDGPAVDSETPNHSDFPSTSVPQSTYTPYDGIWAFNPLAVDDNFVYPTTIPPVENDETVMAQGVAGSSASSSTAHVASVPGSGLAPSNVVPSNMMSHTFLASPAVPIPAPQSRLDTYQNHNSQHIEPVATAKSSKPERAKRNRVAGSQAVVPRRQGPLSVAQRQKADDMRYYGACWRCRRYKKPCNGPGTCDTCLTSGFRVWPSTIGCYRGNMENFISGVMPGNAEQVIDGMTFGVDKVPNWKTLFGFRPDMSPIPFKARTKDKYEALSIKLRATRMAGKGFVELLEILANYQRSRTKPDTCLELACSALNHICDIYHAFVKTDTPIELNAAELLSALTKFRTAYNDNWRHFLQLCLSGRRSAWFPAFLCACLNVPLLVVLKDGFTAIPEPARSTLWPSISFLMEDLRNRLYPMGLDLLGALAKGIKPWKLRCWDWKERLEADGTTTMERDPDGMRLLAGDIGAFDGFAAVQHWLSRNRVDMLGGVSFLTTPPFSERNAKMQPIAALAWIFEVTPPKETEQNGVESPKVIEPV